MKCVPGIAAAVLMSVAPAFAADDVMTATSGQPFADVVAGVESAIVNRGFHIDYHGFIGDMLKRTAGDVGATKAIYKDAEFFTFCSAVVSRKVMEAEAIDIAYCPYVVFIYEAEDKPGEIVVGHRKLPAGGERDQVNTLLDDIVTEAAEGF